MSVAQTLEAEFRTHGSNGTGPGETKMDGRSILLEPYRLNAALTLRNRIVMAPLTRSMADHELVPTADMAAYYARRAEAGLIISEATIVRPDGQGYPNTPGIFNDAQIKGWHRVTGQVRDGGGKMFLQLWHVGRVSHPVYLNGKAPIAPSAVGLSGRLPRTDLEYEKPRALDFDEIPALVEAFAQGASNAIASGFEGVEIHGGNGYLIDQFLHHHTNRRTDGYGGAPEQMARFVLEVVDAVVERIGHERVGIRLSPAAYVNGIEPDERDAAVFRLLLPQLTARQLAYVHAAIFDDSMTFDYLDGSVSDFLRRHYEGTLIGNGSYTPEGSASAISSGDFDLVAIGRSFIANPDLIVRIRRSAPLTPYDESMLATLN